MKKNIPVKSITGSVVEYLNTLPEKERNTLEKLRQSIKAAAPKAEEVISYRIPTYKLNGPLVHFMAGENHLSFITVSKSITQKFKEELKSFKTSGTTIHFTPDKPLRSTLIKKIVKERIKENQKGKK
jgi:uncharacterized protein YdhG (YjbR/CyaY superfamily)